MQLLEQAANESMPYEQAKRSVDAILQGQPGQVWIYKFSNLPEIEFMVGRTSDGEIVSIDHYDMQFWTERDRNFHDFDEASYPDFLQDIRENMQVSLHMTRDVKGMPDFIKRNGYDICMGDYCFEDFGRGRFHMAQTNRIVPRSNACSRVAWDFLYNVAVIPEKPNQASAFEIRITSEDRNDVDHIDAVLQLVRANGIIVPHFEVKTKEGYEITFDEEGYILKIEKPVMKDFGQGLTKDSSATEYIYSSEPGSNAMSPAVVQHTMWKELGEWLSIFPNMRSPYQRIDYVRTVQETARAATSQRHNNELFSLRTVYFKE